MTRSTLAHNPHFQRGRKRLILRHQKSPLGLPTKSRFCNAALWMVDC